MGRELFETALALFQRLGLWEILIIVAIILILFGATKIPKLMRGLGSGITEFKKGLNEGEDKKPDA